MARYKLPLAICSLDLIVCGRGKLAEASIYLNEFHSIQLVKNIFAKKVAVAVGRNLIATYIIDAP